MVPILTEQEKLCIRILAKRFEVGHDLVASSDGEIMAELQIDRTALSVLLAKMEYYGVISDGRITPAAVQSAREIDKGEQMDLVEWITYTVRRKPYIAWPFIVFTAIIYVATAITTVAGALKIFHLID